MPALVASLIVLLACCVCLSAAPGVIKPISLWNLAHFFGVAVPLIIESMTGFAHVPRLVYHVRIDGTLVVGVCGDSA